MSKGIAILGATGSIGQSALKVARELGEDRVRLVTLTSHTREAELLRAAGEFKPSLIALSGQRPTDPPPAGCKMAEGEEGLIEAATHPDVDLVLVAIVGTGGLKPALAAIDAGKDLAVASKEILVLAGGIVMQRAKERGVQILPVDSEHNAIFQCLNGEAPPAVRKLILTCSGGPFRHTPAGELARVTPQDALRHPTWNMGKKITIDSATLFNKGLEMLEARWLFQVEMDRIDVVIHPSSVVHSMVEFCDGSILAQMSVTDMAFPIRYAFTWPERLPGTMPALDLVRTGLLEFEAPRREVFPALDLAAHAGRLGGSYPGVLNAANEVAVEAFLRNEIPFPAIWETVGAVLERAGSTSASSLEELFAADREARVYALERVAALPA
jgi:1-deoxy-D-xylulose-5-phosphate reductoisomerase